MTAMHADPPTPNVRLSIVIPTHNRRSYLKETLRHLYSDLPQDVAVIVVDDGSTDGTSEWLEAAYPQVIRRQTDQRSGPGLARNLGVQAATGSYFLPLDSDCYIDLPHLHWLVQFLKHAQERTYLFPCLSWPQNHRSVTDPKEGPYPTKEILLRRYAEVVPVFPLALLRSHELQYLPLFAGGELLLLAQVSQHQTPHFIDRVMLAYRTDVPMRISGTDYQLTFASEIADVFQAHLPFFAACTDRELQGEQRRILLKLAVYRLLAGAPAVARTHLRHLLREGTWSAAPFLAISALPTRVVRLLFRGARKLQSLRSP